MVTSKYKFTVASKPIEVVESKAESNKKSLAECDMGYDIIEYIKKIKTHLSLFVMCNLPRQTKKYVGSFWFTNQ